MRNFNCPMRWHNTSMYLADMVPHVLHYFIRRHVPLLSNILLNFGVRHRYRDLLTTWPYDRDIASHRRRNRGVIC